MSTAAFPGALGPVLVNGVARELPSALAGSSPQGKADLTIHRITETHHGRTLLMLGHAAEHIANSLRFVTDGPDSPHDCSDAEAVHILLELSRTVFDEFAARNTRRSRVEQWLIGRVTETTEGRGDRRKRAIPGDGRQHQNCATC